MTTTINHVSLVAHRPEELALFFEQVCGFRRVQDQRGGQLVVLESEDGFVLTVATDESLNEQPYPKMFHIGLLQPDRQSVSSMFQRIRDFGYACDPPGEMRGNTFGFFLRLQGLIPLEVNTSADC